MTIRELCRSSTEDVSIHLHVCSKEQLIEYIHTMISVTENLELALFHADGVYIPPESRLFDWSLFRDVRDGIEGE